LLDRNAFSSIKVTQSARRMETKSRHMDGHRVLKKKSKVSRHGRMAAREVKLISTSTVAVGRGSVLNYQHWSVSQVRRGRPEPVVAAAAAAAHRV
jgi:hypothetical protein